MSRRGSVFPEILRALCNSGRSRHLHRAQRDFRLPQLEPFVPTLDAIHREGLIAVNYAARAKGVSRHMRVAEAKQKCPDIRLVHVETIGGCWAFLT